MLKFKTHYAPPCFGTRLNATGEANYIQTAAVLLVIMYTY